jgi:hypothetical protein
MTGDHDAPAASPSVSIGAEDGWARSQSARGGVQRNLCRHWKSNSPQPSYYNELAGWRNKIKENISSGKERYYSGQQLQTLIIISKTLNIRCI